MEKFSILSAMRKEHVELESMINKAVRGFELSKDKCESEFDEFSQKLEKHFSLEEKAIYAISKNLDATLQSLIRKIFSEHETMRAQVMQIGINIKNEKYAELSAFLSTIRTHQHMEEKSLYHRLDLELSTEEKNKVKKALLTK